MLPKRQNERCIGMQQAEGGFGQTDFLIVDTEGVLPHLYTAVELVFAGSSLHPKDR